MVHMYVHERTPLGPCGPPVPLWARPLWPGPLWAIVRLPGPLWAPLGHCGPDTCGPDPCGLPHGPGPITGPPGMHIYVYIIHIYIYMFIQNLGPGGGNVASFKPI